MVLGFGLMALAATFVVVRAATSPVPLATPYGLRSSPLDPSLDRGDLPGPSSSAYRPGAAAAILGDLADATIPPSASERRKCRLCAAMRRMFGAASKISPAK